MTPSVHHAVPLNEYLKLPTAPETWLVEPLLPAGGLANLYGPPKLGKSWLALDLARSLSNGDETWLNFAIPNAANVLYLQLDTPRSLWINRFDQLNESGIAFTHERFFVADSGQAPYPFVMTDPKCIAWLREQCERIQPSLIVIDTTREAHQGDENSNEHMQQVVSALVLATRPAACLLVSHSRKLQLTNGAENEANLMDDNRGSNYVNGRVDTIIGLRGKESQPNKAKLVYQGRAVPHSSIPLTRNPETLLWETPIDTFRMKSNAVDLAAFPSIRAAARHLAEETGEPEAKCYSTLRRIKEKSDTKRLK